MPLLRLSVILYIDKVNFMKDNKLYIYVAGMATGIIMSMFSLFVADQVIVWLGQGGSLLFLILTAVAMGLLIGGGISYLISRLS